MLTVLTILVTLLTTLTILVTILAMLPWQKRRAADEGLAKLKDRLQRDGSTADERAAATKLQSQAGCNRQSIIDHQAVPTWE